MGPLSSDLDAGIHCGALNFSSIIGKYQEIRGNVGKHLEILAWRPLSAGHRQSGRTCRDAQILLFDSAFFTPHWAGSAPLRPSNPRHPQFSILHPRPVSLPPLPILLSVQRRTKAYLRAFLNAPFENLQYLQAFSSSRLCTLRSMCSILRLQHSRFVYFAWFAVASSGPIRG